MPESHFGHSCQSIAACFAIPADNQTVPYISPQQHAALLASLPRVWTVGLLLLGSVITALVILCEALWADSTEWVTTSCHTLVVSLIIPSGLLSVSRRP